MIAEKERGGDHSRALRHQVARILSEVEKEKQQLAQILGILANV